MTVALCRTVWLELSIQQLLSIPFQNQNANFSTPTKSKKKLFKFVLLNMKNVFMSFRAPFLAEKLFTKLINY